MTHKPRPRPGTPHMMTEERLEIQALPREFARDVVLPIANELDPVEGQFPDSMVKQMADMGFFGILIPEEYGGLGLGVFEYCLVAEELSRAWMSVAGLLARGNGMGGGFSPEQEARLLPKVASGEYLGASPRRNEAVGCGESAVQGRTNADGDWVINGTKMWCTYADQADYIVLLPARVWRRSDRDLVFLVEKERHLPEGISAPAKKIGYHGWKTWELSFDNFVLPADALLGEEGRGFYQAVSGLEVGRAHTAARSIGLAQAALEDSVKSLKEREQFGHPLADFQHLGLGRDGRSDRGVPATDVLRVHGDRFRSQVRQGGSDGEVPGRRDE